MTLTLLQWRWFDAKAGEPAIQDLTLRKHGGNTGHVVRMIHPPAHNSMAFLWKAFFIVLPRAETHQPFVLLQ